MSFKRFYRYDFAVTQVFVDLASKYYGITISAHILAYTPTSVIQILNETRKPFFVDPMTFVFARDLDNISKNGKIKRSYLKILEEYGEPFSQCARSDNSTGNRLVPSQFKDANGDIDRSIISGITRRILTCQSDKCVVTTNFDKYQRILKKGRLPHSVTPEFLVAPYFFADRYGSDWYNISLQFALEARNQKGEMPLYPVICISNNILWYEDQILRIVEDYQGFDGYLIWIDNLDEESVNPTELKNLTKLISKLAGYGKPVYSLYGGYLCDLLRKFGLSGYSSGICYGERRSVDAKGGGAGNRFYIPTVHVKISEDQANLFFSLSERNRALICSCPTCSDISSNLPPGLDATQYADTFFARMEFLDFRRHFVNVKYEESNELDSMNNRQIGRMLDEDIQAMSEADTMGAPSELSGRHLRSWRTLF